MDMVGYPPTLFPVLTLFVELNYREIRPPKMDDSGKTKYPVLFHM